MLKAVETLYPRVIADYTQAIQVNPTKTDYLRRAEVKNRLGDRLGTDRNWQTAQTLPEQENVIEIIYGDGTGVVKCGSN